MTRRDVLKSAAVAMVGKNGNTVNTGISIPGQTPARAERLVEFLRTASQSAGARQTGV